MSKEPRWVRLADSMAEISFNPNNIAEVEAGGRKICIGRYKQEYFAFTHKCPHASGYFADGFIDALGNVVCPLHRYKFCMKNGRNVTGEGYYLKHWPLRIEEEGVFVGFEADKLFGLL